MQDDGIITCLSSHKNVRHEKRQSTSLIEKPLESYRIYTSEHQRVHIIYTLCAIQDNTSQRGVERNHLPQKREC